MTSLHNLFTKIRHYLLQSKVAKYISNKPVPLISPNNALNLTQNNIYNKELLLDVLYSKVLEQRLTILKTSYMKALKLEEEKDQKLSLTKDKHSTAHRIILNNIQLILDNIEIIDKELYKIVKQHDVLDEHVKKSLALKNIP